MSTQPITLKCLLLCCYYDPSLGLRQTFNKSASKIVKHLDEYLPRVNEMDFDNMDFLMLIGKFDVKDMYESAPENLSACVALKFRLPAEQVLPY